MGFDGQFRQELMGFQRMIDKLADPKLVNKIVRTSQKTRLRPLFEAAKSDVPIRTGLLKKALKIRAAKRKKGRIAYVVTALGQIAYYARIVQKKTEFIRRNYELMGEKILDQVADDIFNGLFEALNDN